jgi:hypothetical protein
MKVSGKSKEVMDEADSTPVLARTSEAPAFARSKAGHDDGMIARGLAAAAHPHVGPNVMECDVAMVAFAASQLRQTAFACECGRLTAK